MKYFTKRNLLISAAILQVCSLIILGFWVPKLSGDAMDKKIEQIVQKDAWDIRRSVWAKFEIGLNSLNNSVRIDEIANDNMSFFRKLYHTQSLQQRIVDGFSAVVGIKDSNRIALQNNLHLFWETRLDSVIDDTIDIDEYTEEMRENTTIFNSLTDNNISLFNYLLTTSDHYYYERPAVDKLNGFINTLKIKWEEANKKNEEHISKLHKQAIATGSRSITTLWVGILLQIVAMACVLSKDLSTKNVA